MISETVETKHIDDREYKPYKKSLSFDHEILYRILCRKTGLENATKIMDEISNISEQELIQCENELIYEMDQRTRLNDAKREGRKEVAMEIAKKMLSMELSKEQVSRATKLSFEEILEIEAELL